MLRPRPATRKATASIRPTVNSVTRPSERVADVAVDLPVAAESDALNSVVSDRGGHSLVDRALRVIGGDRCD